MRVDASASVYHRERHGRSPRRDKNMVKRESRGNELARENIVFHRVAFPCVDWEASLSDEFAGGDWLVTNHEE
jgi:hypothetical protein